MTIGGFGNLASVNAATVVIYSSLALHFDLTLALYVHYLELLAICSVDGMVISGRFTNEILLSFTLAYANDL